MLSIAKLSEEITKTLAACSDMEQEAPKEIKLFWFNREDCGVDGYSITINLKKFQLIPNGDISTVKELE